MTSNLSELRDKVVTRGFCPDHHNLIDETCEAILADVDIIKKEHDKNHGINDKEIQRHCDKCDEFCCDCELCSCCSRFPLKDLKQLLKGGDDEKK